MRSVFFLLLLPFYCQAQDSLPSFKEVAETFYSQYSDELEEGMFIEFARKKTGWYIDLFEKGSEEKLVLSQPYWTREKKKYEPLPLLEEARDKGFQLFALSQRMTSNGYSFERCQYYGYDGWENDIIREWEGKIPPNDTLLEGLARACFFKAQTYLWHQMGGPLEPEDSLQKKLGYLEYPSAERWKKFDEFSAKTISSYAELASRNPAYQTLVGTATVKKRNEQIAYYLTLLIGNRETEAAKFMKTIPADPYARQVALNYLQSCPNNSILITTGDNIFFSLLYVQTTENIRKDITILNYELLGFIPYLNYLTRHHKNLISVDQDFLKRPLNQYFFNELGIQEEEDSVAVQVPLKELIRSIIKNEHSIELVDNNIGTSFMAQEAEIRVNPVYWKTAFKLDPSNSKLTWRLPELLALNDLMIFDLILMNWEKHPICFTSLFDHISQSGHLSIRGLVYMLQPSQRNLIFTEKDFNNSIDFYTRFYKPVILPPDHPNYEGPDPDIDHMRLHNTIIQYYVGKNKVDLGKQYARKYLSAYKNMDIPLILSENEKMVHLLFRSEMEKEAIQLLEVQSEKLYEYYTHYSSLTGYYLKEQVEWQLDQYRQLLSNRKFTSPRINRLLDLVRSDKE